MANFKRLPDAEFEIMKILWKNDPPVSTGQIMSQLDEENHWKPQTVLTLLVRLIGKGFLSSEKVGRERNYTPLITEEEYLEFETGNFIRRYHENSITGLVNTLYNGKNLSDQDIAYLKKWLDERS